jgi:Lrp/AsnC family transcriptional regulator for asnA, asnC and gidA
MNALIQLDEIDKRILTILIDDARTSLRVIAKKCGLSSMCVLNRINRLKKNGVIIGATLFPAIGVLGFQIVATIGIETDSNADKILDYFRHYTYLVELSTSVGEYDLTAVIYAENISKLNEQIEGVKKRFGVRKVIINIWSGMPHLNYNNVDLTPLKEV